jgi:hypothetical protein
LALAIDDESIGVVTGIIVGVTSGDLGLALRSGFIARTPRELQRPN